MRKKVLYIIAAIVLLGAVEAVHLYLDAKRDKMEDEKEPEGCPDGRRAEHGNLEKAEKAIFGWKPGEKSADGQDRKCGKYGKSMGAEPGEEGIRNRRESGQFGQFEGTGGNVDVRSARDADQKQPGGLFREEAKKDIILVDVQRDEFAPGQETINRFLNRYNMVNPHAKVSAKNVDNAFSGEKKDHVKIIGGEEQEALFLHAYQTVTRMSEEDGILDLAIACDENGDFGSTKQMFLRCLKAFFPLVSQQQLRQKTQKLMDAYEKASSAKIMLDGISCTFREEDWHFGDIESLTIRAESRKIKAPEFEMLLSDHLAREDRHGYRA